MRLLVLATTVLSVFIGLGSHTPALAFNPDLPLLSDISVTEPDKSMPKEFSHFSGWWYGGWFGSKTNTHMSDHILIVETIAPPTATVVYSWRAKPRWGGREVVLRLGGKFENEELVITFENGSQARYRPRGDDELSGTYQDSKQGRFTSILKKISPIK